MDIQSNNTVPLSLRDGDARKVKLSDIHMIDTIGGSMRVGKLIVLFGCLIFLGGCTNNNVAEVSFEDELMKTIEEQSVAIDTISSEVDILKNLLSDNEVKIAELKSNLDELIEYKQEGNESIEPILKTMNLSHDFIEAYIEGDFGKMKSLASGSVSIIDDEIHLSYGDEVLKHGIVENIVGYSLNGYGLVDESVMYHYSVYKEDGVDITGIFIMTLEYKQVDGLWKLIDIEFDI